jgi:ATP-binding cassette subfamily B protein
MSELRERKRRFKEVFEVIAPVLMPRKNEFIAGGILVLGSTLCEVFAPILLGKGVDVAIAPNPERIKLFRVALAFLGVIILRAVTETLQGLVIQRTGQKVIHDLRTRVFKKLHSLPISYFDAHTTGRLLTRVINDIKSLSELFTASISVLILDVMIIVGSLISMVWLDWRLALVVLLSFPLVFWTIWSFGERLSESYKLVRSRLAEINSFLGENIGAIATIQRLGAEDERLKKFHDIVELHTEAQMKSLVVYASVQPYANVLNGIAMASLMGVGGYWAIQGKITLGVLVAFFAYLRNLFQPIRDLVEKYNTFLSAMVAAERVVSVLKEKGEEQLNINNEEIAEVAENTTISFQNVSFKYSTRENLALDGVSFTVPAGKSVAIVGATGSGKSTIIRLLMRFYEPTTGQISFAGKDLKDLSSRSIRKQIGVIQQEVYLFSGTVRDNLTLGRTGWTDLYLEEVCRQTGFWELVKNRGGLDMVVFESGSNFSLGERQLLAFSRTWLFNPQVLVLDEATASVDPISEKYLMSAIKEGVKDRTSIVIAHRLSTIKFCDYIVVMEKGRIAEQGTFENLLKKRGLFFEFHQIYSQQGEKRVNP